MLRHIWIAECDLCGERADALLSTGRYGESEPYAPPSWIQGINKNVIICPNCASKLHHEEVQL